MANLQTKIEWTEKTWNVIRGCSIVSPGCQHCYAMRQAYRFNGAGQPYEGLTAAPNGVPRWTGKIRLVPEALEEPLRWRKPCRVFVNSMSDLFHEDVPDDFIDHVFAVMGLTPRHTYQILTKRPERMREYLSDLNFRKEQVGVSAELTSGFDRYASDSPANFKWPLPNVWLLVSCENQKTADERIPILLQTPAAVRGVSLEPLLEKVDISRWMCSELHDPALDCRDHYPDGGLDWCVVGGESGPDARPCELDWIRSIVEQCKVPGTPIFCKQLGSLWAKEHGGDSKGGDMSIWPNDLQIRRFPNA